MSKKPKYIKARKWMERREYEWSQIIPNWLLEHLKEERHQWEILEVRF